MRDPEEVCCLNKFESLLGDTYGLEDKVMSLRQDICDAINLSTYDFNFAEDADMNNEATVLKQRVVVFEIYLAELDTLKVDVSVLLQKIRSNDTIE